MGTIIEDLESGKTFFRVILTTSIFLHHDPKGVIIPYEKLSFERDSAGTMKIKPFLIIVALLCISNVLVSQPVANTLIVHADADKDTISKYIYPS